MTIGALLTGWLLAGALGLLCLRLHRRLELVAQAEHELRGPAGAIGLAAAALRREPGGLRRALAVEAQLDRMRAGLADLEAARTGRRAPPRPRTLALERVLRMTAAGWRPATQSEGRRLQMRWDGAPALVRADPDRLAQALGNLVANAVEHGSGPVELRGRTDGGRAVVEVRDSGPGGGRRPPQRWGSDRGRGRSDRGRGLAIAARAAEEAGGRITIERREDGTTAAVELPLRES